MEAITRIAQIAKPMIVFTVLLLEDARCETSSNYGAMGQGCYSEFFSGWKLPWAWSLGVEAFESGGFRERDGVRWRLKEVHTGAEDANSM
jgi:hypothetical protein